MRSMLLVALVALACKKEEVPPAPPNAPAAPVEATHPVDAAPVARAPATVDAQPGALHGDGGLGHGAGLGGGGGMGSGAGLGRAVQDRGTVVMTLVEAAGGVDKAVVQKLLSRSRAQLMYCYEKELQRNPSIAGTMNVSYTVEKSGKVAGAKAEGVDAAVAKCVQSIFARGTYPMAGMPTSVRLTLDFGYAQK